MFRLQDSYGYESYALEYYEDLKGPPLIQTKSRLIAAVVQNEVDLLRDLLDSSKWYNVTDEGGYNLLQISILRDNKEVFDYLMTLPDFSLEFVNSEGETALSVSLRGHAVCLSEHFAFKLLQKGACIIEKVDFGDDTLLHCALDRSYIRVAKLLMEAGVDVNTPNNLDQTPLDLALLRNNKTEAVMALLVYGAEPSFEHFRTSVLYNAPFEVQENLFLYLCDEYSEVEIDLNMLLKLASAQSPLFHEIMKFPIKISSKGPFIYAPNLIISIENLNVMLESNIRFDVITFINTLSSGHLFEDLFGVGYGESSIEELYCFLLSYGLNIDEMDLQLVYEKFGYCELFKILLHMDIRMEHRGMDKKNAMPIFIYDVSMNLEKFLAEPCDYASDELFSYFAHPKLVSTQIVPQMPLLVELSRNAFRKFLIEKFHITTSRKFFTVLNCLPISPVHKRIITYETKLYF